MIVVSWREKVGEAWEDWQEREFPEERLQEFLDRAWKKYGNPALIQGGPSTKDESANGSTPISTPTRKRQARRSDK